MNSSWKRFILILPLAICLPAAGPVASLTSYEPVILDGYSVSVNGVNSWPLVLGDEIGTIGAPIVLVMQSGKRIEVAAHSRVKLTGSAAQPKVEVQSGKITEVGNSTSTSLVLHSHATSNGPSPGPSSCFQNCE
jgi:hypothetical protein